MDRLVEKEGEIVPDRDVVLGIQYGGHDTAASVMVDGRLIAACEQERYSREKHCRHFPNDAIADCLKMAGIGIEEVEEIGFCFDPVHYIRETYLKTALEDVDRIGFLIRDIDRIANEYRMEDRIREETGFKGPITFHRHHLCHLASTYYPSGFGEALLCSFDGMGEIETSLIGIGREGVIDIVHEGNRYPHSFGLLYSAVTFYLGWKHHCDEGIVMGLAPYGDPDATIPGTTRSYREVFAEILVETGDYDIAVNTDWIAYHKVRDTWISERFTDLFGPRRLPGGPLTQSHRNVAAALQARLEEIALNQLRRAREAFGLSRLCLAGGVALNCSMNGKIEASRLFDEIFVQPASGDNGTVIGACYLSHARRVGGLAPRRDPDNLKGSRFSDADIAAAFNAAGVAARLPADVYTLVAKKLAEGKIVAWFQGGAEFGPRALGNRSILTRPYPAEMKDYLNARVKFREEFRPFAPAILAEFRDDYFLIGQDSPHMLIACQVRPEKRDTIPAVVHVDGSCRVQTVSPNTNARFYRLLKAFHAETGCPVLLNTSFNVKGQPIVNTPAEAIDCFCSTNIDVLVVGNHYVEKTAAGKVPLLDAANVEGDHAAV